MSCAVMFQPCLAMETSPLANTKVESSPPSSVSHGPLGNVESVSLPPPQLPNVQYQIPEGQQQQQIESQQPRLTVPRHRPQQAMKISPSSPIAEESSAANLEKLCVSNSESYTSPVITHTHQRGSKQPLCTSALPIPTTSHPSEKDVKYVSANCVVVTHYQGETSAVVDEHFSRALATRSPKGNDSHIRASRNFPPSYYQPSNPSRSSMGVGGSFGGAHTPSELYEAYHGGFHSIQASGNDPWSYAFTPQSYAHRTVGHDIYHSAMTSASHPYQYSSLGFQQPFSRLPTVPVPSQINKSDAWGSRYYETFVGASDLSNGMDTTPYSPAHYHNVPGIEAGMVQECTKDLYWL